MKVLRPVVIRPIVNSMLADRLDTLLFSDVDVSPAHIITNESNIPMCGL